MHEGLLPNLLFPKTHPRNIPRLERNFGLAATQEIIYMCGDGLNGVTSLPEDKKKSGSKDDTSNLSPTSASDPSEFAG